MAPPADPKIYHIVHVDRLASIIGDGVIWSDAQLRDRGRDGTVIGMATIKARRLNELQLSSHPGLFVGECVPFYFCPRSVMLYLIHRGNHAELSYRGGQGPIVHLEADLKATVAWAERMERRWAFTLSNAGAYYFEDRCDLDELGQINWDAVVARQWSGPQISSQVKEGKQAEFLVEHSFPWELVEQIGVYSNATAAQVVRCVKGVAHRPRVGILPDWYY